ncbi:hypothetical protein UFOVP1196_64 [uncultured Caudovirales phage]|uniref:Uncharacterized protein n=1 Tax=uncultured Caudovirales phage TaxID=2100421 RepID=A0A6J5RAF8_9CAUD|nr:hypothetical protein UFOVP1196_64 [uncultured Caudovirales phage]
MSILDTLRSSVAIANKILNPLQVDSNGAGIVTYEKWLDTDGAGLHRRLSAVQVPAIVDWDQRHVRSFTGEMVTCRASVTFLDPAVIVNVNDKITLPDGSTGPILSMRGPMDAVTGRPLITEVFLG